MNRIFNTVFSHKRGVIIVGNELTKAHQVGKKAAMAAAVGTALASFAVGAGAANFYGGTSSIDASDLPGGTYESVLTEGEYARTVGANYSVLNASSPLGVHETVNGKVALSIGEGVTVSEEVIAGSRHATGFRDGDSDIPKQLKAVVTTNETHLTITGGTFTGEYVWEGGDLGEGHVAPSEAHKAYITVGDFIKDRGINYGLNPEHDFTVKTANTLISGGDINMTYFGGSIVEAYSYQNVVMDAKVETGNTTITGGTFKKPLYLGGAAYNDFEWTAGAYDDFTEGRHIRSTVDTANLLVKGDAPVFEEGAVIYAGGLTGTIGEGKNRIPTEATVGEANITIDGAQVGGIVGYNVNASYNREAEETQDLEHAWVNVLGDEVKTNLTMKNGASATEVQLGSESHLAVEGEATIDKLKFANGTVEGVKGTLHLTEDAELDKTLALNGDLTLDGGLKAFAGMVNVNGNAAIVGNDEFKGMIALNKGGTFNYDASEVAEATFVMNGGTLSASSDKLFEKGLDSGKATDAGKVQAKLSDTENQSGTIALSDKFYNLDYVNSAYKAVSALGGNVQVTVLGTLVTINGDPLTPENVGGSMTLGQAITASQGGNVSYANTGLDTTSSTSQLFQVGGTPDEPSKVDFSPVSLSMGHYKLGTAYVIVDGGLDMTAVGDGEGLVTTKTDGQAVNIGVVDGSFNLGGVGTQGGALNGTVLLRNDSKSSITGNAKFLVGAYNLQDTGTTLSVGQNANVEIGKVTGRGSLVVGNEESAAKVTLNDVSEHTGVIFLDPAFGEVARIADASNLEIYKTTTGTVSSSVVAGQNSVVTVGADSSNAAYAFESISKISGVKWGSDVTAALYACDTINFSNTGKMIVNGAYTQADFDNGTVASALANTGIKTVSVAPKGMLIVNQAVNKPAVAGKISFANGSYLGVVNANAGTFDIATMPATGLTLGQPTVVTDNPFIRGELINQNTQVRNTVDGSAGLGALASTGIQALTRRADSMLAARIADRTSLNQAPRKGVNLWVDVTAERYETDGSDNGGQFKADSVYGSFGADFLVSRTMTAGAAVQYGKSSLDSNVSDIENDNKTISAGVFLTKTYGDVKTVFDAAWTKSDNDITSSQKALNQSVDATMYSIGARAQYQLYAFNMSWQPSIGIRASRLETDNMKVGSLAIEKQKQNIFQVPVELRVSGFDTQVGGWTLTPKAKLSFTPTMGDKDISIFGAEQTVIDTNPIQGELGLRAIKGRLMFKADLSLGSGSDGASYKAGKVGVHYLF